MQRRCKPRTEPYYPTQTVRPYCTASGKTKYTGRKQALTAAAIETKTNGFKLYVYKCRECRSWHMTKSEQ